MVFQKGNPFVDTIDEGPLTQLVNRSPLPPVPLKFFVSLDPDLMVWKFFVSDYNTYTTVPTRSAYRIYFCPISLATPAQMSNEGGASDAFKNSFVLVSAPAPPNGGDVTVTSAAQFGNDGWFFCTAVGALGYPESAFNGPVRSPVIQTDLNTAIPPPVSDQTIAKSDVVINGQTVAKLDFEAVIPTDYRGVVAITVDVGGSGYTTPPDVIFTPSGAVGAAILDGDAVASIQILDPGNYPVDTPAITFSSGAAAATASMGQATLFSGYQLYIQGYQNDSAIYESVSVARNYTLPAGSGLRGTLYLLPDNPPSTTDVFFFFVSLSPHGNRRTDIASAPSFTIAGGIT